jgi:hypothetical protein
MNIVFKLGSVRFVLLAACVCAAFLHPHEVQGTNLYVSLVGSSTPPYTNWAMASTNIQWAVNASANGDTVWISNGTYVLTGQVIVASNIKIFGYPDSSKPIIDGNNSSRCFNLWYITANGVTTLSNLFITRGNSSVNSGDDANGGGVRTRKSVNVFDCIFSNNVTTNCGGGMLDGWYTVQSSNNVLRCTFIENKALNGGGLHSFKNSSFSLLDHCIFQANTANNGGGVYFEGDLWPTLTGCVFICNVATNQGGGYWGYQIGYCSYCTFTSNICYASSGGGVYGAGSLSNCSISYSGGSGVTTIYGGLPACYNCLIMNNDYGVNNCTLYNCTVVGNSVKGIVGGGTIYNSIIYFNSGGNYANSPSFTNSCTTPDPGWGSGNITNNPMFVSTNTGNYRLQQNSPCINAGLNQSWMESSSDLDGHSRLDHYSRIVDMGCYEYLPSGMMISVP